MEALVDLVRNYAEVNDNMLVAMVMDVQVNQGYQLPVKEDTVKCLVIHLLQDAHYLNPIYH